MYTLETLNRGPIETFGFDGANTNRVLLGEFPDIPLDQFSKHSTEAILASYGLVTPTQKIEIKDRILSTEESLAGVRVRNTRNLARQPRHLLVQPTQVSTAGEITIAEFLLPEGFCRELEAAVKDQNGSRVADLGLELMLAMQGDRNEVGDYRESPFRIHPIGVDIGGAYLVDHAAFAHFATHIQRGGAFGWIDLGVTDFILEDVQRMADVARRDLDL